MKIEYDARKRARTLKERGLDFDNVPQVFDGLYITRVDDRRDYGEVRHIILGALDAKVVVVVWTARDDAIRVISMRHADDEERQLYREELDRSG
jgi:uncharacterized protein